jgi:hypothetical protein
MHLHNRTRGRWRTAGLLGFLLLVPGLTANRLLAAERVGSRFVYLDEREPYYPHRDFPKLTTPMWVGEPGVEAVVILSIDDMGRSPHNPPAAPPNRFARYLLPPEVYARFLEPVVARLQKIDGRAPITIFTCEAHEGHPLLQQFLKEGMSLDVHTAAHWVPLLRTSDATTPGEENLRLAVRDVLDCLENLSAIPNNRVVACRIPGCDAQNTNSPRFYSEVFPRRTRGGKFLSVDSSVFQYFTSADRAVPRELMIQPDGRERFGKFITGIPQTRHFTNHIANYPYPYVIDRIIWEFPVIVPADSHGVHAYKPNNPQAVEDWKRAVDVIVRKQGLYTLCFHPHGYIKAEQVAELVDYIDRTYGKRVKFLNCREVYDRLTKHLLDGVPLRSGTGADNGVRLLDVNGDGYLDVVIANGKRRQTRVWQPTTGTWKTTDFPVPLVSGETTAQSRPTGARFFTTSAAGPAGLALATPERAGVWHFDGNGWAAAPARLPAEVDGHKLYTAVNGVDRGVRFRDLDGDGTSDLLINNEAQNAVFFWRPAARRWERAAFALPEKGCLVDGSGIDQGLRFVDLNQDGAEDLVLSNDRKYWVSLFEGPRNGWAKKVVEGKAGDADAPPAIVYQGELNGVWFRDGVMVQMNEFTAKNREYTVLWPYERLLKRPTGQGSRPREGP